MERKKYTIFCECSAAWEWKCWHFFVHMERKSEQTQIMPYTDICNEHLQLRHMAGIVLWNQRLKPEKESNAATIAVLFHEK